MVAPDRVAAVILAAGRSRRYGQANKLLAPIDGQPMILHVAAMLSQIGFRERIVVCGPDGHEIAAMADTQGFSNIWTARADGEMSHSLATGIRHVSAMSEIDAALICLADMPFVSIEHIRRLLNAHDGGPASIVASSSRGAAMPPALFGREYFDPLSLLQGDMGARALLDGAQLVYADKAVLTDIDRVEDLGG